MAVIRDAWKPSSMISKNYATRLTELPSMGRRLTLCTTTVAHCANYLKRSARLRCR
jgi:hypothetical protein